MDDHLIWPDQVPAEGSAREGFLALLQTPEPDLCEAALWIAAESYPGLDIPRYLDAIDGLAEEARGAISDEADPAALCRELTAFFHGPAGFRGNGEAYYDARNSFLNEVMDRRLGIPISLAILWIGLAQRLGHAAEGVSFPGHFLAKLGPHVIDVYGGQVLGDEQCEALLQRSAGPDARFDPRLLNGAKARPILARMLANLKQIHVRARDFEAALACSDRIVALLPDEALEWRDRGLLYRQLDCYGPALRDLERFVAIAHGSEEAKALDPVLRDLRSRRQTLN